jgi:hypothetical protein
LLHGRIVGLRDKAYAHSDAEVKSLDLDYTKSAPTFPTVETLSRSETEMLKMMIEKWVKYLKREKSKLKDSLTQPT